MFVIKIKDKDLFYCELLENLFTKSLEKADKFTKKQAERILKINLGKTMYAPITGKDNLEIREVEIKLK